LRCAHDWSRLVSGPHFVLLADIGGARDLHVGDEAMLYANVLRLRRLFPGVRLTLLSRDPAYSAHTYQAEALRPFGFSTDAAQEAERSALLEQIRARLNGREAALSETAQAVIDAIATADGVFISGGGNMSSSWPHHLYERIALLECARAAGIPAVITGQTLGPNLSAGHRQLLRGALPIAALVGLRERPSYLLALALDVPAESVVYQLDDALFMPDAPLMQAALPAEPFIAVTLHPMAYAFGERTYPMLAGQLEAIARQTGLALAFIPHVAESNGRTDLSDVVVGEALEQALRAPLHRLPLLEPAQAVWATRQAAMVISSRYHPLVFATSVARPALGLPMDEYTEIKLGGALRHAGLEQWILPLGDALKGNTLQKRAQALWDARADVQAQMKLHLPLWREQDARLEQRVTEALRGENRSRTRQ
jgi:polysaccharide pyruvyl transferase WcaK-like protein